MLKIRDQVEPVLTCLQARKIKLRYFMHNSSERCQAKPMGFKRLRSSGCKQDKSLGLTSLLRWEGWSVVPREHVPHPFLHVQKVGSAS